MAADGAPPSGAPRVGLPLAGVERRADAAMTDIPGDGIDVRCAPLCDPTARRCRKIGHVTRLLPRSDAEA